MKLSLLKQPFQVVFTGHTVPTSANEPGGTPLVLLALFQAIISEKGFFYIFKYIIYNVTINIFYFIHILYFIHIFYTYIIYFEYLFTFPVPLADSPDWLSVPLL